MTVPLRIIDTGERPARWNVAATAALTELHCSGRMNDTLRFHRYPASVLAGRHQVLNEAIHLRACRADGIEIARRVTGGGAVYMAPGALAWDLILGRKRLGGSRADAARTIGEAIAAGIARLGLAARYRAENEIEIAGRKICGMSGYHEGDTLAYQGTILIDTDLRDMARYLRLPLSSGDSDRELASRLMTLCGVLGRRPDPGELESAIAGALVQALGYESVYRVMSSDECALIDERHRDEFGRNDFVFDDPRGRGTCTVTGRNGLAGAVAAAQQTQAGRP